MNWFQLLGNRPHKIKINPTGCTPPNRPFSPLYLANLSARQDSLLLPQLLDSLDRSFLTRDVRTDSLLSYCQTTETSGYENSSFYPPSLSPFFSFFFFSFWTSSSLYLLDFLDFVQLIPPWFFSLFLFPPLDFVQLIPPDFMIIYFLLSLFFIIFFFSLFLQHSVADFWHVLALSVITGL